MIVRMIQKLLLISLFVSVYTFSGCAITEDSWEDLELPDFDEQLNVFALISLDPEVSSFVAVHRTLPLSGAENRLAGRDTVWYGEDSSDYYIEDWYESLYAVKDAQVTISDGVKSYPFSLDERDGHRWWEYEQWYDEAKYLDGTESFVPEPLKTYTLEVTTTSGHRVTGEVTTPPVPDIDESAIPDTLEHKKGISLAWNLAEDRRVMVKTLAIEGYVCGSDQFAIMPADVREWRSEVEDCRGAGEWWEEETVDSLKISVHAIDENYYDYFVRYGLEDDFSSILLGQGSTTRSVGLEGGIGVFCAMASDRIYRVFVP